MFWKIRNLLHPSLIERYSIYSSIKTVIRDYKLKFKNKSLLDIGCGSQPYKPLFESNSIHYEGIDFKKHSTNKSFESSNPDYYFNSQYKENFKLSSIKDKSYEILTTFQVLEHHEKPMILFEEANRILKDQGYFLITFPFIWELHEEPSDFQRLTHFKIDTIAETTGFKIKKTIKRGNLLSVISQLSNTELINSNLNRFFKYLLYLSILYPLQIVAFCLNSWLTNQNKKVFLGYTILLKKDCHSL